MSLADCFHLARSLARFGPLMALLTIGAVWCGGFVSLIVAFPPSASTMGKLNFLTFFAWLPFTLSTFFRAILLGPGFSPHKWQPQNADDAQFLQFCRICEGYKPPRAHHCRRCRRCCLKMDHHCVWLGKCVGFRNQASFLFFLFGAVFGALHATCMIIVFSYLQLWVRLTMNPNLVLAVMITSGFGIGTFIAVGVLLYQQVKIALTNKTGIELWILEKAKWRRKEVLKTEEAFVFPYDLGWRENLNETIGFGTRADGIFYPVVDGSNQFALTVEQKLQKSLKKEKSVRFKCVKRYSGRMFPVWDFPRSVIHAPCCDDTIALDVGDEIVITRGRKHWYYGFRPSDQTTRGFLPKAALEEIVESELVPDSPAEPETGADIYYSKKDQ